MSQVTSTSTLLLTVDRVSGISADLILRSVTDQSSSVGESHNRRCHSRALQVSYDLNVSVLVHAYARENGSKVDSNSRCHLFGRSPLGKSSEQ